MTGLREAIARALVGGGQNWQEHEIENRELVYQSVDEILAAIEAAGWQVVPKEPTREMKEAGGRYKAEYGIRRTVGGYYRAMLAAAPKP
jgi:TRAP-type C4-dicarboxylate transport system substrate-binding protein